MSSRVLSFIRGLGMPGDKNSLPNRSKSNSLLLKSYNNK